MRSLTRACEDPEDRMKECSGDRSELDVRQVRGRFDLDQRCGLIREGLVIADVNVVRTDPADAEAALRRRAAWNADSGRARAQRSS